MRQINPKVSLQDSAKRTLNLFARLSETYLKFINFIVNQYFDSYI